MQAFSLKRLSAALTLSAVLITPLSADTSVAEANAALAFANYSDTVTDAKKLRAAIGVFVANPSATTLEAAKKAWLASRESYGQTEVFRFRGGPIDDDASTPEPEDGPEGQINAWPLAEALVDYVAIDVDGAAVSENPQTTQSVAGNIIADKTFELSTANLATNNELGGDEANVTTGYHAIEFLLWGQDLNQDGSGVGKRDTSAGQRPYTDYAKGAACTNGNCERRALYLTLATELLIDDLQSVADQWHPEKGAHYARFSKLPDAEAAAKILEGMGRLSYGELAGERMNIALVTDSQEDEHSCFSDNTHRDIVANAQGIKNVYFASYGDKNYGAGIYDWLVAQNQKQLADKLKADLEKTMQAVGAIDKAAKNGLPFDNQIQGSEAQKQVIVDAIIALRNQTHTIEEIMSVAKMTADLRQDTEEDIESK